MLVLIAGLPGSGKSTIARAFSLRYGAVHLNSDTIRRELGLMGAYTPADKQRVYTALLLRASAALHKSAWVVVDSTFYRRDLRDAIQQLAIQAGSPWCWVEVIAADAVIRERVRRHRADSEADEAVYERIKAAYEPFAGPHLVLRSDEGAELEEMVMHLYQYVRAHDN